MSYKIIIRIVLTLLSFSVYSQNQRVGINTTEPTKELDVDGNLRVRGIPKFGSSRSLIADATGVLGYTTEFALHSIESKIAEEPINTTSKGVPLGLETTVTIPANTEAKVIIEYSVPVGIDTSGDGKLSGYAGVMFMRQIKGKPRKEAKGGSRKYTTDEWYDETYGTVVTVITKYVEEFDAKPHEQTITYSLNSYVENTNGSKASYRFNMYSATGDNRNWGKGIITQKVYLK